MYLCYIIYGKHHSLLACWDSHSFRSVSKSTCTPLAANFLCCRSKLLSNFFCRRSRSLRRNSSAGIGSPEQVTGCALWAGRPGPFLVCSFFLHFARRFWNHTCKIKFVIYCKFIPNLLPILAKQINTGNAVDACRGFSRVPPYVESGYY